MSKEIESLLKDMKDCDVKGNIIFYSSLVTLYFQQSDFEGVKNVLQEMKRLSVEPNIEFYGNLLDKYIQHNKNGSMSKEIESLLKVMNNCDVKGNIIFYSSLVTLYFQQSDFEGVKNVLQEMKRLSVEPNIEFYTNLLSKYSESGKQTEFENTLQTINNSDCIPNEVTVSILLDVIGKRGWGRDIDIDKLAIKYRILIDNKNLCPSNFVRAYSHLKHDDKAKKFWFKYCKSHDLYQSPVAVSIAIDAAGHANDHEWLQGITKNLNFNNLNQNNINSLIEASCRLKLFEEAIGCVKYFMAMFDEFEDYQKTIGTIRNGFESCKDKSLKEEVSMLMKKLRLKNLKRI
jgi:pentatricopeptide repeat protein